MNESLTACGLFYAVFLATCLLLNEALPVSCKKLICRSEFIQTWHRLAESEIRLPCLSGVFRVSPEAMSESHVKGRPCFGWNTCRLLWAKLAVLWFLQRSRVGPSAVLRIKGRVSMTICLHFSQLVIPQCNKTVWSVCLAPLRATFSHKNAQYPPQHECKSLNMRSLAVSHAANS